MSCKSKMGAGTGLAPPGVSVAHYALNAVEATPQFTAGSDYARVPEEAAGIHLPEEQSVTKCLKLGQE
ncbi:hypothetical protein [Pelotomaculum sp. PtaB.Bin117]|uniref:hypothetical protein n=1 Tax=Pelotomaculum sp. PtaB.Bin117 TaxID=1811694 RepID=UPI00257F5C04|nr:hypothetical protein [Pelotomaculum sp. PtaB.Bin117]